ncbi:MAG: DUF1788 domain-containing protein [Elusimicrobia bacterium]|nr:DUF1788 domain-containing protein [Elusimicrobiota bacterium]
MGRIEDLSQRYYSHISAPWQRNLAGAQKTIFVVYDKDDERKLRARLEEFETRTVEAGHPWKSFDFTPVFAKWMSNMDYRESYFEEPDDLSMKLQIEFVRYAAEELRKILSAPDVTEDTVIGVYGVASLFGFTKVSLVLKEVEQSIKGRLVLFFPGEYENNNYRLLDARDGWNYLAVPITLHGGVTIK